MKIDPKTIEWIEMALDNLAFGEVGITLHVRNGAVEWTEKIKRETTKSLLTSQSDCEKFGITA